MRIAAVTAVLPARKVTNADLLGLIREHSRETCAGDLGELVERIERLLVRSGAESRFWCGPGERPLDLAVRAVADALTAAGMRPSDVDLLVYASIDRGFVEPAAAYFVAAAAGMHRVHCFDVGDACNGWSRAAQVPSRRG